MLRIEHHHAKADAARTTAFTPAYRRVEAHARAQGAHPAVRFRDQVLTYAELDRRADALAQALTARGVHVGDRVVMLLEPELDVPAVLLAVHKAGAVYVPVDPTYPVERIAVLLEDVAPRLVVSRRSLLDRLGVVVPGTVLALDDDAAAIAARSAERPYVPDDATRLATLFHTSGTTGRPKGARATHANVAFFAESARERYGLGPHDVVPVIARFTFSISIFEVLVPLAAGATIVVLDREVVMDPVRLTRALEAVTFFHAGPSLLKGVLATIRADAAAAGRFARVRHASSGGDMVPPQVLTGLLECFPRAEVFVIYGCSEVSCMGCTDEVPRGVAVERTYVGRPFADTQVRVVDAELRPVPVGEVGEVLFSGPGVIAGYVDRAELEAEKFVQLDGARWYRTGDVGRMWEGRGLELLGRTDFQVKIRGMRVECAEVEYHLRQVPGVRDGAVVGRELRGEKVLAAYVVRDPAQAPRHEVDAPALAAAVRRALADRVPDYMVPAAVVELDALPLNHNLKLDRHALPPLASPAAGANDADAPRTDAERWMAACWCELLQLESVHRRQNFFELGGDSLLAMQVVARAELEFGMLLEGMALLRETLAEVARLCEGGADDGAVPEADEPAPAVRYEAFRFGRDEALHGFLVSPAAPAGAAPGRAVVLCGPAGSDDVRPSFVLTLLARRLAERGIPVLRFDYFGTRDSDGLDHEAHPDRWRADIHDACAELASRTGTADIVCVGVRLGGTLLLTGALPPQCRRVVVWDPILDGREHLKRLRFLHARVLNSRVPIRPFHRPRVPAGRQELVGFTWDRRALEAVTAMRLPAAAPGVPVGWLASVDLPEQRAAREGYARAGIAVAAAESGFDAEWDAPRRLGELMPDAGIVDALIPLVEAR